MAEKVEFVKMLLLPCETPSVQPHVIIITGHFESTRFLGLEIKQQQQQIKSWFNDTSENGQCVEITDVFLFSLVVRLGMRPNDLLSSICLKT